MSAVPAKAAAREVQDDEQHKDNERDNPEHVYPAWCARGNAPVKAYIIVVVINTTRRSSGVATVGQVSHVYVLFLETLDKFVEHHHSISGTERFVGAGSMDGYDRGNLFVVTLVMNTNCRHPYQHERAYVMIML